jgi:hypothetical protein
MQKNNEGARAGKVAKGLDADAWRRAPLFGADPTGALDSDVLHMMLVALGPGIGAGSRQRILRAAVAFSNAATAAFELGLETKAGRWNRAAVELHESLETALAPSEPNDPNFGWFVYSQMGLMLKDLLPDRSNYSGPSDRFCVPVDEVQKFKRLQWRKKLRKYCPPQLWKRDSEMFFRLATNYRRISNECHRRLPKRTRNEGRPGNPERVALLKWVQAQDLEAEALSRQLKKWSRQLALFGGYPRGDMPPFADKKNEDGTWLYATAADHAEAFAKWWDRRIELTYKWMRYVLKNTEKDAKRAEQKRLARQ